MDFELAHKKLTLIEDTERIIPRIKCEVTKDNLLRNIEETKLDIIKILQDEDIIK